MKWRMILRLLLFAAAFYAPVTAEAAAQEKNSASYVENEVIIACRRQGTTFKKGTQEVAESLEKALREEPITNLSHIITTGNTTAVQSSGLFKKRMLSDGQEASDDAGLDFYVATLEEGVSVETMVEQLRQREDIYWAEPNYLCTSMEENGYRFETDELVNEQWFLEAIDAPAAWKALEDDGLMPGENVTVAVVDTGVSLAHSDLIDNLWVNEAEQSGQENTDDDGNGYIDDIYGVNLVNLYHNMTDSDGHGTMMAGLVSMTAGNGGGAGVAYGARVMPVKVSIDGNFGVDLAVEGIQYALDNGADVISMSFGTYSDSLLLRETIQKAAGQCMLVAAAGNESLATEDVAIDGVEAGDVYPASYDNVVGVMAYSPSGELADFSNWDAQTGAGAEYELAAPGESILSTYLRNGYAVTSGTSPATALTAGAMAVCRGIFSDRDQFPAAALQKLFVDAMNHTMQYQVNDTYMYSYRTLNLMDVVMMAQQKELIVDKEPPVGENLTAAEVEAGSAIRLQLYAEDNFSVQRVTAYYRYPSDNSFRSAQMEQDALGIYYILLPGGSAGANDTIEYYFSIYDGTYYTNIGSSELPQTVVLYDPLEEPGSGQEGSDTGTEEDPENSSGEDPSDSSGSLQDGSEGAAAEENGNQSQDNLPQTGVTVQNGTQADAQEQAGTQGDTSSDVQEQAGEQDAAADTGSITKSRPVLKRTYQKKRKKAVLRCTVKGKKQITGYYIYRSGKKKTGYRLWKKIKKSSFKVKVSKKKKYYRVVAYTKYNNRIYKSKKSEVVSCFRR